MRTTTILAALVALTLVSAPAALSQEEEQASPRPDVVALSMWKCPFGDLEEAVDLVNGTPRAIHEELIDEGRIVAYNVLTHFYGDEWNLVLVTLAESIEDVISANSEFFSRAEEREPGLGDRFTALCPEHKDNIYSIAHPEEAAEEM